MLNQQILAFLLLQCFKKNDLNFFMAPALRLVVTMKSPVTFALWMSISLFTFQMHGNEIPLNLDCDPLLTQVEGPGHRPTRVDISGDFDPKIAWKQAGLDPNKIFLRLENNPNGSGFDESPSLEITMFHNTDQKIGALQMYEVDKGSWGTQSGLEDEFLDRGIGALMYLISAEVLFRLYPNAISLDSWEASRAANLMWEKLVRNGHASKSVLDEETHSVDEQYYYELAREHITPQLKAYVSKIKGKGVPRRASASLPITD